MAALPHKHLIRIIEFFRHRPQIIPKKAGQLNPCLIFSRPGSVRKMAGNTDEYVCRLYGRRCSRTDKHRHFQERRRRNRTGAAPCRSGPCFFRMLSQAVPASVGIHEGEAVVDVGHCFLLFVSIQLPFRVKSGGQSAAGAPSVSPSSSFPGTVIWRRTCVSGSSMPSRISLTTSRAMAS